MTIETLHLDRGSDSTITREICADLGIDDAGIAKRRNQGEHPKKQPRASRSALGIERTSSWLSNFDQLRHKSDHRRAQFVLALVLVITASSSIGEIGGALRPDIR